MALTVDEARAKRKKKKESKKLSVDTVREKRKEKKESEAPAALANIASRYNSIVNTYNKNGKQEYGLLGLTGELKRQKSALADIESLKNDIKKYGAYLGEDKDTYLSNLDAILEGYAGRKEGAATRAQFGSEGEFAAALNQYKWQQKYSGMSADERKSALENFDFAPSDSKIIGPAPNMEEYNWLKAYDETKGYEELGVEGTDAKIKAYERIPEIQNRLSEINDALSGKGARHVSDAEKMNLKVERDNLAWELQDYQSKYGFTADNLDTFDEEMRNLRKYYKSAKDIQTVEEFSKLKESNDYVDKSTNDDSIDDEVYRYVNDTDPNSKAIPSNYLRPGVLVEAFTYDDYENRFLHKMSDEEKALYNYIYKTQGEDKANEYLDAIQQTLNERQADEWVQRFDGTFEKMLFAAESGLDQFGSGIRAIYDEDAALNPSATQMASEEIRKGMGAVEGFFYDTIQTTSNQVPHMLSAVALNTVAPVAGQAVGLGLMGASAAGNGYAQMMREGYSSEQAATFGILSGTSEIVTEKLFGGISALGGASSKAIKNITKGMKRAGTKAMTTIALSSLSEAGEEAIQSVLEQTIIRNIALGEENGWSDIEWGEVMYSALLGATSGLGMSAAIDAVPSAVRQTRSEKTVGSDVVEKKGAKENLIKSAESFISTAEPKLAKPLQGLYDEATKEGSPQSIGRLAIGLEAAKNKISTEQAAARMVATIEREKAALRGNTRVRNNPTRTQVVTGKKNTGQRTTETATRGEYEVPTSVPVSVKSSGVNTEFDRFETTDGGDTVVRLKNGEVVDPKEVSFEGSNVAPIYETVTKMDVTAAEANALVDGYRGLESAVDYAAGIREAYAYGQMGMPQNQLENAPSAGILSETARNNAYELGRLTAEGKVDTNEEGIHLRRSSERADGKSTAGQITSVEGEAGQNQSRREGRTESRDRGTSALTYSRRVGTKGLGIERGKANDEVRTITEGETAEMKRARRRAESRGLDVVFFAGDNLHLENGVEARAYIKGNKVYVRVDHAKYTADQLMRHEVGHNMIARGEVDVDEVRDRIIEKYGEEAYDEIATMYAEAYDETGMDAEEIWEEIICDSLGDINIFSDVAEADITAARHLLEAKEAAEDSTKPARAPPGDGAAEGKYSFENTSQELIDFVDSVLQMQNKKILGKRKKKIGIVNEAHAKLISKIIKAELGIDVDVTGYEIWIDGNGVQHIEDKHGKNGSADQSMKDKRDIGMIPWVVNNADSGSVAKKTDGSVDYSDIYKNSDNSPAPIVVLEKQAEDNTFVVAEAVPDSQSRRLYIVSGYKKSSSNGRVLNIESEDSPQPTSKTPHDGNTTTDTTIPQNKPGVKTDSGKTSREIRPSDSDGNALTKEQQEYFKDSMVRDANGNLLVVYHGTDAEFNVFDFSRIGKNGKAEGFGFYFSDDKEITGRYGDIQKKVYLNITKPLLKTKRTMTKAQYAKLVNGVVDLEVSQYDEGEVTWQDSFISNYVYTYERGMTKRLAVQEFVNQVWDFNENDVDLIYELANGSGKVNSTESMRELYDVLTDTLGYDGIFAEWTNKDGTSHVYVTFNSEQSKNVNNTAPTTNPDIRYSREVEAKDAEYMSAVKSGDMETAQKLVDEAAKAAGYTEKVYHGTTQFGFTKIKPTKGDDGISFFATDAIETAETYSDGAPSRGISSKARSATKSNLTESKDKVINAVIEARNGYSRVLGEDWYNSKATFLEENRRILDEGSQTATKSMPDFSSFAKTTTGVVMDSDLYIAQKYARDNGMNESIVQKLQEIYDEHSREVKNEIISYDKKSGIYGMYANTDGHLVIDAKGSDWAHIKSDILPDSGDWTTREVAKYAKDNGYSGVTFKNLIDSGAWGEVNTPATVYVFFNPQSQVKSADPVTRDAFGRVIPLDKRFNPKKNDIRYSREVEAKDISDREILANALEGAAQNDAERANLAKYKAEIAEIEKLEATLREQRAEIKEMSFAKGKRDQAYKDKLSKLRLEAQQNQNRIDIRDKRLLRLEATKALSDLLARERAKVRKQASEKYRAKTEESRKSRITRDIVNRKNRLESTLLNPTDGTYVPQYLVSSVVDLVNAISNDTPLIHEKGRYKGLVNKAQLKRNKIKEKLSALKEEYENLKTDTDPTYSSEFEDAVLDQIKRFRDSFSDSAALGELTLEELKELDSITRTVSGMLSDARKLIGWDEKATVYGAGIDIIDEQESMADKKTNIGFYKKETMSPLRIVHEIAGYNGDSTLVRLMDELNNGVRVENKFVMDSMKEFEHLVTGKNEAVAEAATREGVKLSRGKYVSFTDAKGNKFVPSKMQMMQAILSWERETADDMNHMSIGGMSFPDLDLMNKGKVREARSKKNAHRVSGENTQQMITEFRNVLANDAWAQEYMKTARHFFNVTAKNAINKAYMEAHHRTVANGKAYIPFEVDQSFVVKEISDLNAMQQTIEGFGFLKKTQEGSANPIVISGLGDVLNRHIQKTGTVAGLMVPVRNFNKVWNVSLRGYESGVRESIESNWGDNAIGIIEQAVKDVQGSRVRDDSTWGEIYEKAKSNLIAATFMLNMSVVLKQIGSYGYAASRLGYKNTPWNFIKTAAQYKSIISEIDQYTATQWIRRQGLSDKEVSALIGKNPGFIMRNIKKIPVLKHIHPSRLIQGMDSFAAAALWEPSKKAVKKMNPKLEGEELLKATAKFYDELIENTQSVNDPLHTPEIKKSANIVSEALSIFKTDLFQMSGDLRDAIGTYSANKTKENRNRLFKSALGVGRSVMWSTVFVTTLMAIIRGKDDEYRDEETGELTVESVLSQIGENVLAEFVGLLLPAGGDTAFDIFESFVGDNSYDVADNLVFEAVNDVVSAASKVVNGDYDLSDEEDRGKLKKDMLSLVKYAAGMFGIPASNVIRTIEAVEKHFSDKAVTDSSKQQNLNKVIGVEDAAEGQALFDEMVNAYTEDRLDDLREENDRLPLWSRKSEEELREDARDSVLSEFKSKIGDMYKDGEVDKASSEGYLRDYFGMTDNEIYWQLDKWDYAKQYGSSEGYTKYAGWQKAVENGEGIREEIRRHIDHTDRKEGETKVDFEKRVKTKLAANITEHFKPLFVSAKSTAERARIKARCLWAYEALGYNRMEKNADIDAWLDE